MARENLSGQHASDTVTVRRLYDEWAPTYDAEIATYGYEAPGVAAARLASLVDVTTAAILDAGCGTGLVGAALSDLGANDVTGVDVSPESLASALATGAYRTVAEVDFNNPPVDLDDDRVDAVICVGVMTYLPDVAAVGREFSRITKPGGVIVMTQRSDLFVARKTSAAVEALVADETWEIVEVTDGLPYLPKHVEYQGIDVHYLILRVR